jgi:hypothetical protein
VYLSADAMVSFSFLKFTNPSGEIHVENGMFNTLSFYHVIDNSSTPGGFLIGYSVTIEHLQYINLFKFIHLKELIHHLRCRLQLIK